MPYEAVGAGYVFAIADADGASPGVFTAHDNAKLYCNFGNLSCAAPGGGAAGRRPLPAVCPNRPPGP